MKRLFLPVLFIICLHLQAQKPNGGLQSYSHRYFVDTDNFKESFEAYKKYHELNQLVFNAEADHRISQLQTEMEVSQKENTILLQMSRLRQQNVIQVFALVLMGAMLLFLFILYRYFIQRKRYSLILEKQNKEKEFLLKEIHHRVKYNLETISSLLSLQTAQIEDQELHDIMIESQNRVQSMGMDKNMDIKGTGFGTQLIRLLTQQLDGKMTLTTHCGTRVLFEFQVNSAA